MFCEFKELAGLTVTVDKVVYMPHLEAPPERPYPFAYYITIRNDSDETDPFKGRKWVVKDDGGNCLVVEGDGVVGKSTPVVSSRATNFHPAATTPSGATAWRKGSFFRDERRQLRL